MIHLFAPDPNFWDISQTARFNKIVRFLRLINRSLIHCLSAKPVTTAEQKNTESETEKNTSKKWTKSAVEKRVVKQSNGDRVGMRLNAPLLGGILMLPAEKSNPCRTWQHARTGTTEDIDENENMNSLCPNWASCMFAKDRWNDRAVPGKWSRWDMQTSNVALSLTELLQTVKKNRGESNKRNYVGSGTKLIERDPKR